MIKNISIIGSTGSIGTQTLDCVRNLGIKVEGLSANSNIELLEQQINEFSPKIVSVGTEALALELKKKIGNKCDIHFGQEGLIAVATVPSAELVVTSIVGIAGLVPTVEGIKKGKNIALANKETLVAAGSLVMELAKANNVDILPVDSEHSAIFQCLRCGNKNEIEKLILTASGGPFRGYSKEELKNVTLAQALKHPNWSMGHKVTIDSASMMNKGLEVIEARWLFGMESSKIEVVVHAQSVIHSMVEYVDGSVIAQLGAPDMRLPIQYAITYPKRAEANFSKLDFTKLSALTFEKPDFEAFKCLKLAFEALKTGGTMPAVMNAANEIAVGLFLQEKIKFYQIGDIVENIMLKHIVNIKPSIDDIIEVDKWARKQIIVN